MLDKIHQALGMEKWRTNRLIAAAAKGSTTQVAALLDAGVSVNQIGLGPYPEAPNPNKALFVMSPLMAACKWSQPETVELLLSRGAHPGARAMDEVLTGLIDSQPWTDKANRAVEIVEAFVKAGCRFEGRVGEEYMFAQHQPVRHESLNQQLARLCPGENLSMDVFLGRHLPARLPLQS